MPLSIPAEDKVYTTQYTDLHGVDFTANSSSVYKKHSPTSVNMISDEGGNPKKRWGWETVISSEYNGEDYDNNCKNMWSFDFNNTSHLVCHVDDKLCRVDVSNDGYVYDVLMESCGDNVIGFFVGTNAESLFCVITNGNLYEYVPNGETYSFELVTPYVPTTIIGRSPTGGGTIYESVNLLTRRRIEQFITASDGSTKSLVVTQTIDKTQPVTIKVKNASGNFVAFTGRVSVSGNTITATIGAPPVEGEDNVMVEYTPSSENALVNKFLNCTAVALYENRVFLSGLDDDLYSSYVWYSDAVVGVSYFPDLNYAVVGSNDTKILGLAPLGEYLGVIKESNSVDTTVYFMYSTTYDDEAVYAVKQFLTGVGAVSANTFGSLDDAQLFLAPSGICALSSTAVKNRSYYLNKKLFQEENLQNSAATVWDGYYILSVNSHCYILDTRQKTSWGTEWTNFVYECYYWENVDAKRFAVYNNTLWFSTSNGTLRRFKTTDEGDCYNDDGEAIYAEWSTPLDNDGATQLYKTLLKKGTVVSMLPYAVTSAKVYLNVDNNKKYYIGQQYADRFYFSYIDFDRFTFDSNDAPIDIFINKKIKKYKRLQFIIANDVINEPFVVYEITKSYTVGSYSKRKSTDGRFIK